MSRDARASPGERDLLTLARRFEDVERRVRGSPKRGTVPIYHGTSAVYRESISGYGLRPRGASASKPDDALQMRAGGPYVTTDRAVALKFGRFRTAAGVLFRGEPNQTLLVSAHLPEARLERDGRVPYGFEVPGGIAPDELSFETGYFASLETEEGCLKALSVFTQWRRATAAVAAGLPVGPGWDRPWSPDDFEEHVGAMADVA